MTFNTLVMAYKKQRLKPSMYLQFVSTCCHNLRKIIFAGEYGIGYNLDEKEVDERSGADKRKTRISAEIEIDTKYLEYKILLGPSVRKAFNDGHYETIYRMLIHETCHVLTEELFEKGKSDMAPSQLWVYQEINERQTQRIANTIEGLLGDDYLEKIIKCVIEESVKKKK